MNAKTAALAVAVAVIAVASIAVVMTNDGDEDPGIPMEPLVPAEPIEPDPGYPDGVSVDAKTGTVTYKSTVTWHVTDMLSPAYVKDGRQWVPYTGYSVTSDRVELGPGMFDLSMNNQSFTVVIPETLERASEWIYDMDGVKHRVSVSYTLDIKDLAAQRTDSIAYNAKEEHQFADMPSLAKVSDDLRNLAASLEKEFVRIGGDASDRQGFADFLAAYVDLAITYPSKISGKGEDWSIYGYDEYWALPLETLNLQYGDCEDTSALLCALYTAAGYKAAMGGVSGHVFAGVALDPETFVETSKDRLEELDPYRPYTLTTSVPVEGSCEGALAETLFYAVETTRDQLPVGYYTGGTQYFGMKTSWGTSGFYPVVSGS